MMTQQLGVSILSAPLAAIDRRALSEAWYSALHLARNAPRTDPCTQRTARAAEDRAARSRAETARRRNGALLALATNAPRQASSRVTGVGGDRRARSSLGRKIEKMIAHPLRQQHRATFTIDGTGARVHVILRTSGELVHVVAICTPALRARVSQALAEACSSLAERGIGLGFETRELVEAGDRP